MNASPGHQPAALDAPELVLCLYREALLAGPSPRTDLVKAAESAGAGADAAEAALAELEYLLLLRPVPDRPGWLAPVNPAIAETLFVAPMEQEIRDVQHRLQQLRTRLEPLKEIHQTVAHDRSAKALLRLGTPEEIHHSLEAAARDCTEEVLTVQPGGPRPRDVLASALPRDLAMLDHGIRMRTLYQHSARFSGPTQAYVEQATAHGAEVRTREELGPRLLVFDRREAFIPDAEDSAKAVVVRDPAVIAYLVDCFERSWATALPFTTAAQSRNNTALTSAMQRSVARLVLTEEKDGAIARRLGISERTCRTHIAKLMRHLGARNRTHLGYLLATAAPDLDLPAAHPET